MEGLRFTIIIPPTGQMRARTRAFRVGDRLTSRAHKHEKQEAEEGRIGALLLGHRPPEPLQGPLILVVRAYLPIPQSQSKKWKAAALACQIAPEKKPDWDNLGKNLCDVMNGIFWVDDKQIVDGRVIKLYGDPARWEIEIRPWVPEKRWQPAQSFSSGTAQHQGIHPELFSPTRGDIVTARGK